MHKNNFLKLLLIGTLSLLAGSQRNIARAQNERIVFAVISDYGVAGQPAADVATLVKSWNPDFIVTSGDNNQIGGKLEMDANIGQYYHEYLFNYAGDYGAGSPTRRFFPVLGNHDWSGEGVEAYLAYFRLRDFQRYYEFTQGPVHFFMLDSDRNEPDGAQANSQQALWLKKALAASTSPFNLVVFHHPPYTSGWHKPSEYMRWPFKEWGADAVLSGHNHLYERLTVDGLPYFINGLGGAKIYKFETVVPESQVRFNLDYGAMRVEATDTTIKFQMYTRAGMLVDEYAIGQTIPLVATITPVNPTLTNANVVEYAVHFSEPVSGVDLSDFSLATTIGDATINAVNGSGADYRVSINTGTVSGTLQLNLMDDDSIFGASSPLGGAGSTNGNFSSPDLYTLDKTPPAITSITRMSADQTNANSVDYSVRFSEPVIGVDGSDFSIYFSNSSGAFISAISGSNDAYVITLNAGSGDTTLRLDGLNDGSILDAAGNAINSSFTNGESYTITKNISTVTSIVRVGNALTNSASVDFIVTFSEPVNGVNAEDFSLSAPPGAFISAVANSNPFYIVTVNSGTGDGTLRLNLTDDDSIINLAGANLGGVGLGNGNFFNGETYMLDKTAPLVTSIQSVNPSPSAAQSMDFIVTFSEPVNNVDAGDFSLNTNLINASITNVTNANPFYVISISAGSGSGSLQLTLADNDSVMDAAGNPLGGWGVGNASFSASPLTITKAAVDFPAPTLVEPRRNLLTTNATPSFSWTPVRNARAYEISLALDENFSQIVFSQIVERTTLQLAAPLNDGIYFWKLRAYTADFLPGKDSMVYTLKVDRTPPAPPQPVSPADHSPAPRRPWLKWTADSDAVLFQIQVDNNSNFSSPEFVGSSKEVFVRAENLGKGVYYWRIVAKDAAGNWGNWSPAFTFATQ
ncbi:MAG: metallophosphoesterase [Anaerolineales bacterium]|nr:metallophosphoesterase [Anaerolineales bacterium]